MAKPNLTKENRVVFVIMPFVQTPTRNKNQLTAYFEDQIKHPIENGEFKFKYSVQRSDNTFNITDNREEINKIDWSNFRWSFGSQPAVDYYLSNLYLYGLIPKETEMHFTAFLIAYHAHFVGTTYFQGQWASGSIWQFLGETKILQEAITGLKIILNVHELQAKAEVLKRFKTLLESTRLPVRERKTAN